MLAWQQFTKSYKKKTEKGKDILTERKDLPPYEQASYLLLIQIPDANCKLVDFHLNKLVGESSTLLLPQQCSIPPSDMFAPPI